LKRQWKSTGDPTEVALQVFSMKLGLGRSSLTDDTTIPEGQTIKPALGEIIEEVGRDSPVQDKKQTQINFADANAPQQDKRYQLKLEFPFSSELKRMTTVYVDRQTGEGLVLIKGAVSVLSQR
jgi:magnesium-transporting ATPase (P-type)